MKEERGRMIVKGAIFTDGSMAWSTEYKGITLSDVILLLETVKQQKIQDEVLNKRKVRLKKKFDSLGNEIT